MENQATMLLLFEIGLRHLLSTEQDIYNNLATMIEKSQDAQLRRAFEHHQKETEGQIKRLKKIYKIMDLDLEAHSLQGISGMTAKGKELLRNLLEFNFTNKSKGIAGIFSENSELLRHFGDSEVSDMVLAGGAVTVEQFEIARYKQLIILAEALGKKAAVTLLQDTLMEEEAMSDRLESIARTSLIENVETCFSKSTT